MLERSVLRAAVYAGCRGIHSLRRASARAEHLMSGLASNALSAQELRSLTARLYDAQPDRVGQIFAWEKAWWELSLPKAPARILIGGAGRGREVRELLKQGYEVWAFDPSRDSIRQCQQENSDAEYVGCFGYEDLLEDRNTARGLLLPAEISFHAVIMGWGSLSHVIGESSQRDVISMLASLTPKGPLLVSFLSLQEGAPPGRAERIGAALGRRIAALRAQPATAQFDREHVRCLAHGGVVYFFTESEIKALADACGRTLELHIGRDYPHAVLWPPAPE